MENDIAITINGVKEVEEKKLVGFRVICENISEYGQEIPKAFMTLEGRKDEIKQLVEPVKLISAFKAEASSNEDDGYWVCCEVQEFEDIPEEMVKLTVPAQKHAVLNYSGQPSEIFNAYSHLHKWIEENGFNRQPEMWTLEIYSAQDDVDLYDPIY